MLLPKWVINTSYTILWQGFSYGWSDKTALNNKGFALYYLGDYTQAIQYFDKALAINPKFKVALNNKGAALYYLGNYTGAILYFDKALGYIEVIRLH